MSFVASDLGGFALLVVVAGLMCGTAIYVRHRLASQYACARELDQERERRREVEEELGRTRIYFQNIIGISEDAIISADAEQRITLFNQGAEKTFGYRSDEVIGQSVDLLIPPRFHASHRRHVDAFAGSPDILRPMSTRGTLFGRRKDGTEFPIEASISKFHVRGEPVLTVRLRDVTNQRKAEEGLQRLAAIVESSHDAIIGKTLDGIILSWNTGAERLYGYAAAEVTGRSVSMLMPPDRSEELGQILDRVRRGDRVANFETVRVRKDGTRLDISLSVSPIKDAAGQIVGVSAIARDITERNRLDAQFRQAQKMEAIGTLAGGIAHDFNNILGAIIGHTEMAADTMARGSDGWQELQEVVAAGKRASDLVRQILTFSRRAPDQEHQPVELQTLIREVMRLLRASLPATIEFRQQIEAGRTTVLADATQLHQVLVNLCTNAEHAMRGRSGLLDVQLRTVEVDVEFAAAHPPLQPGTAREVHRPGHRARHDAGNPGTNFRPVLHHETRGRRHGHGLGRGPRHHHDTRWSHHGGNRSPPRDSV